MEVAFNWLTAIRKCCYVNYFLIPKENWFFFNRILWHSASQGIVWIHVKCSVCNEHTHSHSNKYLTNIIKRMQSKREFAPILYPHLLSFNWFLCKLEVTFAPIWNAGFREAKVENNSGINNFYLICEKSSALPHWRPLSYMI